jgi:hypothetical protein
MNSATRQIGRFHLTDRIVMVVDYDAEESMVACKAGACAISMVGDTLLMNQGTKID